MQMDMKYGATVAEQKDKAMLQKAQMDNETRRADSELRTSTTAHDTVIKTQTQLEVEQMKAQLALIMAQMDLRTEKAAMEEAVERGI